MEKFDDISLMGEVQRGNRDAFSILVDRHSKYFYGIAYRFVNNREAAEDILQTGFMKLWERSYKFDCNGAAGFKTWFARCIVNLCLDDRRSRRPMANLDDFEIADDCPGISENIERGHKSRALHNAILKLSDSQRVAINLGVIQELQYLEVGKIMNKSEGAVKVLINRAKESLRITMKEQGYGI